MASPQPVAAGDMAKAAAGDERHRGALAQQHGSIALVTLTERFKTHRVVRRTGQVVHFDHTKIENALLAAFDAVRGDGAKASLEQQRNKYGVEVCAVLEKVLGALWQRHTLEGGSSYAIESIQDQVELALMRSDCPDISRAYARYREQHAELRFAQATSLLPKAFSVIYPDGTAKQMGADQIHQRIESACSELSSHVKVDALMRRVVNSLHNDISYEKFNDTMVLEARTLIERHHHYAKVAARLLLDATIFEVTGRELSRREMHLHYGAHLTTMVGAGIRAERLDPKLRSLFDLKALGQAIRPERDDLLDYLGLQTLYDRYLIKDGERRIELPQSMWMRVAMGLAVAEDSPTERAIEFYELLSTFRFMSSTPTLFNAGTVYPQLSSCYLTTVPDDLYGIYGALQDNAMLSKFAGGLGNDWTPVRAMGSKIKGTDGNSQGVIPFLRVANDTAIAVNQGGKRKGAVCAYLEVWHRDIFDFLDLRKNTGDERRRTHDMNTACWIPDLFMQRVREGGRWILFSPTDVPDLHDKYGAAFAAAYAGYEQRFLAGEIVGREVLAVDLWRKMITLLYETGHPWMTFKDPCNVRSPQRHAGVVHSSNLCTEITLNTSAEEIAVCNLGSINLGRHLDRKKRRLDAKLVKKTLATAMRMLDNVIDINYYSVDAARNSNARHRPVGLGQVGYQDCLNELGLAFDSQEAVEFADRSSELVAYHSYWASSDLAAERGRYKSYEGSSWSKGKLPLDTLFDLAVERAGAAGNDADGDDEAAGEAKRPQPDADGWLRAPGLAVNVQSTLDWEKLRAKIKRDGMRNSNCLAIAPTATIGNIMGASPCIEPVFKHMFVKSNLSGEFTTVNKYLIDDLIELGLWGPEMLSALKVHEGEIDAIEQIPEAVRARHKTCFQLEQKWLIEAASRRQKWLDQSQSLNLFFATTKAKVIAESYMLAWERGLKTTYYCRTLAASSTEKYSTDETGANNRVAVPTSAATKKACAINDPDCEACQ